MEHNSRNVCPLLFRIHASCSPTDLLLPTAAAAAACLNILQWPFKRDQLQLAYSVQFEWRVKRPEHTAVEQKKSYCDKSLFALLLHRYQRNGRE